MRLLSLITAAALTACTPTVPVNVLTELPDDQIDEIIDGASEILDVPLERVDWTYGVIKLDIHPARGAVGGRALQMHGCVRIGWALPDTLIVAHELGHLLGLEHVNDLGNVMTPGADIQGPDLTDAQRDTIQRSAAALDACR